MGLAFLPWERWLPPYIYGPLMCVGSILLLIFSRPLRWWEFVLLPLSAAFGAWVTWAWFAQGRNVLKEMTGSASPPDDREPRQ
jgi:hypothetical protein